MIPGVPLSEKTPLNSKHTSSAVPSDARGKQRNEMQAVLRKPSEIRFVRHRMLYARAALNAKGDVAFGLRHIRKSNAHVGT